MRLRRNPEHPAQVVLTMKAAPLIFLVLMGLLLPAAALGECYEGDCQSGRGISVTSDGGKYVGEFKNWLPNGQGTLTYPDGETYQGELMNASKHGQGTLTYPDGYKYVGEWKDGKRHGYGIESYPGNDDKAGYWVDDMYVGKERPEK